MIFFYQIGIRIFLLAIYLNSFWHAKSRRWLSGRKDLFARLAAFSSSSAGFPAAWFHCASLGEFEQARPLIEKLKNQGVKIAITFFSPSGYEIRKNYDKADFVGYLPLDTRRNARKFIALLKPAQVFFVKYDFWYNHLNELRKKNIPTYLVSANFRKEQFRGIYGKYLKTVLPFFDRIFVQNEKSQEVLSANRIGHVIVTGDLRFDRVADTAIHPKKIQLAEHFKGNSRLMVAGSTWEKDEQVLAGCQLDRITGLKIIIAPHEISESRLDSLLSTFRQFSPVRYSEISKEPVTRALERLKKANLLVIDSIGMLSSLYQYADFAYIGGGFGAGIHNILEAAAFGAPVLFGPNHHKFPEARELADQGGGFSISNAEECGKAIALLLSDEKVLGMASMVCKNFVMQRRGATQKILDNLHAQSTKA